MKDSPLQIEKRPDGVALVWINDPDDKLNKLSMGADKHFNAVFDAVEKDDGIKAVVWISRKEGCFIAGADITIFHSLTTPDAAAGVSRATHAIFDRIEMCPKPNVAAIHGVALGGGSEFALACHWRIATDHPSTYMGFPEVKLGLFPAGGGTQRLPALVGVQAALDLMITGKNIYPRKAKKIGLVDEVVLPYGLADAAAQAALRLVGKDFRTRKPPKGLLDRAARGFGPARNMILDRAAEAVEKKTRGNYSAPLAIIEAVRAGLEGPRDAGYAREAILFGEVAVTPASRQLVHLFFAMTDKKKPPMAKGARETVKVGVLGAGLMGAGIALVTADHAKTPVFLKDVSAEAIARGQQYIQRDLFAKFQKGVLGRVERDRKLSRVHPILDYAPLAQADLVIEAVFENLPLKRGVLKEMEAVCGPECVFASNTSALPIKAIAAEAARPENVIGMHYFSPVEKMPLLEIIRTNMTAEWVVKKAVAFGVRQGKTVIVVKDGPGFYTTRILVPYLNEACMLIEEGANIDQIDRAMKDFGFPVGPVQLMDEVGIDVGAHVSSFLGEELRKVRGDLPKPEGLTKLAQAGFQGRKNRKGFYVYEKPAKRNPFQALLGKPKGKAPNEEVYAFFGGKERRLFAPKDMQDRLSLGMMNEAVLCLEDGIIENATDGDLGAILGLGFPPFLGGPFRAIDTMGAQAVADSLERLADAHGPRFKPAAILKDHAKKGRKFHKA